MLVLGIDPGTATTGYGLVRETEQGDLVLIEYGVILTPAGMPQEERLQMLYERLIEIILLHHPDLRGGGEVVFPAQCHHGDFGGAGARGDFAVDGAASHAGGRIHADGSEAGGQRLRRG